MYCVALRFDDKWSKSTLSVNKFTNSLYVFIVWLAIMPSPLLANDTKKIEFVWWYSTFVYLYISPINFINSPIFLQCVSSSSSRFPFKMQHFVRNRIINLILKEKNPSFCISRFFFSHQKGAPVLRFCTTFFFIPIVVVDFTHLSCFVSFCFLFNDCAYRTWSINIICVHHGTPYDKKNISLFIRL